MSPKPERPAAEALPGALRGICRAATRLRRRAVRRRALAYVRERHLAALIRLPDEVRRLPEPGRTRAIVVWLKATLRHHLKLRKRGHWRYSRRRHMALLAALGGELIRLRDFHSPSALD